MDPGAVRVYANGMAAEPALSGPEVHGEASGSVLIRNTINVLTRVKAFASSSRIKTMGSKR